MKSFLPSAARRAALLVTGLLSMLLASACSYSKGKEEIPPPCTDDLTAVSYAKDIAPILQQNCLKCHGANVYVTLGGGFNYDLFRQFQQVAQEGILVKVLEQTDEKFSRVYMPRPVGSAKLPACDIERIRAWVDQGAKQN